MADTPIFDELAASRAYRDGYEPFGPGHFPFANGVGPGSHRYAVADRNARRNRDAFPGVDQHPETVYDPDNPTERLADTDTDRPADRTGYVGKPGTYYTDQHGTIHLTLDTWEQARERNRARYGNADASEDRYRPE